MPNILTFTASGDGVAWYKSISEDKFSDWSQVRICDTCPENPKHTKVDGDSWREMTGEEIQAEAEAEEEARIGELAVEHGAMVGLLAEGLAAFGIEMPVKEADAITQMDKAIAEKPGLAGAMGKVIGAMYKLENAGITNDDICAIGLVLQRESN